ncbi:MAG TPA: hemagglutinin repeat-containing protein, partial [Steroidobacteraceae bacterium]
PGFIYANNTFTSIGATPVNHSNPILSNAGQPGSASQMNSPGSHPQNLLSGQPVAVAARNGANILTVGGANIPLPTTPNGRFVVAQGSSTGPLIQTNPVLGGGGNTGGSGGNPTGPGGTMTGSGGSNGNNATVGSDYLATQLGLKPDQQARRLGDDNYESYLIQQQIQSETGRAVLSDYGSADAMVKTLFDNAVAESKDLNLSYGTALTSAQIDALTTNIVWLVQAQVEGQTVLVPVVYLATANQNAVTGNNTIAGYNVNIKSTDVKNAGGDITAINQLNIDAANVQNSNGGHLAGFDVNINANAVTNNQAHIAADDTVTIKTSGDIQNLSGTIAGWNVKLNAGGNIVNSTLTSRNGDPISRAGATDVALVVGSISASNDLKLKAGGDVTVNGALVAAGHDAALIAGKNVDIQSFAKTTNIAAADGSSSNQMQSAQNAVVHVGGDLTVRSDRDLNVTGAQVGSSLGTTTLHADKGNVNVGVLELNHTVTSSSTTTGGYTQADVDSGQSSATFGAGVEHTTKTHTMSNTTGMGSDISGNGVVVSTGKGDVNIKGSALNAGTDGLQVNSAGNVSITAYNNTIQDTHTTDRVRAGVQLDANADGVFFGLAQSETKKSTTATMTTAQGSTLKSAGDITISGHGDVSNEGTNIGANGNITLSGKDIVTKAAQNTYAVTDTSSRWETKEQEGLTTNGTGQSIANAANGSGNQVSINNLEWQQRVTGSSSNDSSTYNQSSAQVTSINAGGGITVKATNDASDEGTNYNSGENIVIAAQSYRNKAAADTITTTDSSTYGDGKATAGLNSSAEVALTVSADGGHDKSGTGLSTAHVGNLTAGGNVIIKATTGDATLDGTQLNAGKNVEISAARDVNINQASSTSSASDDSKDGSANVSASVSLLGTGASVGVGTSTTLRNSNDTLSTATAAKLKAGGNITVDAGRDANSEGTDFNAGGNVGFTAKRDVNLKAATDQTDRTGAVSSGGVQVNVGFGADAAEDVTNGGGNINFEKGVTNYHETTQHGGSVTAGGTFSINAGGNGLLQGTQVNANDAKLQTGGNLKLESAQHTISDNSYDVGSNLDASLSKGGGTGGASRVGQGATSGTHGGKGGNAAGGDAQVNVMNSQQDVVKNTNATIHTTQGTTLDVGGDASLLGARIDAGEGVSGKMGGNLTIQSRTDIDNVNQSNVRAYAGLGPIGGTGGGSAAQRAQEGLQTGANAIGQSGLYADVNSRKKDNVTLGAASGIAGGTGGLNVQVGGNTTLTGASNTAGDFHTAGTTTVNSVSTRTSESSTKFELDGTVAAAAGSNNGKGGEYGLNVYTPHAHGDEPPTPAQPKHLGGNEGSPAEPLSAPHGPLTSPHESTNASSTGSKAPNEPLASTHTAPKAPEELATAPHVSPKGLDAPTIVAHLPTPSPSGMETTGARSPKVPDKATPTPVLGPKEPIKLAQAPESHSNTPINAPHMPPDALESTPTVHQPTIAQDAPVTAPHVPSISTPNAPAPLTEPAKGPGPAVVAHGSTLPDEAVSAPHLPSAKAPDTTTTLAHQPTSEIKEPAPTLHVAAKNPEEPVSTAPQNSDEPVLGYPPTVITLSKP